MKVLDALKLMKAWKQAVSEEHTVLGFFDWVRAHYSDDIISDDTIEEEHPWETTVRNVQNDVDTLAVRLDDLERDIAAPETVADMIDRHSLKLEQRIRDAFVCASRSISP